MTELRSKVHERGNTCLKRVFVLVLAAVFSLLTTLPVVAAPSTAACAATPAARELDYWLGDWAVASPGSLDKGHSRVYASLDKCLVVESWGSDTTDHKGENVLAYSAEDQTWYGLFVDNRGRVHALSDVTPGSAEFRGPCDADGKAILKRVRVVRVNADSVEQIWEKSLDSGASWATEFRMGYSRKRP